MKTEKNIFGPHKKVEAQPTLTGIPWLMEPKTRTETKKQGKRNGGPYSAKHVRRLETLLAATAGSAKKVHDDSAGGAGSALSKDRKNHKKQ